MQPVNACIVVDHSCHADIIVGYAHHGWIIWSDAPYHMGVQDDRCVDIIEATLIVVDRL